MCEKCQEKDQQIHKAYLKQRGKELGNRVMSDVMYSALMFRAALKTNKLLTSIKESPKQEGIINKEGVTLLSLTLESSAIEFTRKFVTTEFLDHHIEVAKEIEELRASLTLIQSRAIIAGNQDIEKIAADAISKPSAFAQGSAELMKIRHSN